LRSGVILDKIDGVYGILNGTSNFILSRMSEANKSFEDALLEAQNLGYAEADPSFDINGLDAAHKLSIINSLCFAEFPSLESISIKGIEDILTLDHKYAQEFGYNIKLIASSSNKGGNLRKEVAPTLVKIESSLGTVSNVSNVVCITTEYNGTLVLEGEGAGEGPTSSSVLSDVVDYSMNTRNYLFNKKSSDLSDPIVNKDLIERCYYLRVFLADQKGAMSNLTSILGKNGISIDQVIQRGGVHLKDEKNFTPVIMLTHPVDSDSIDSAFSELIKTDLISMDPIFLPVLKDNL
jgi:homoserine dehydrogenase